MGPETLGGAEPRHQLPHPRAVEEGDLREVQEDLLPVLGQELVHRLAEDLVAEARGQLALHVDDDDVPVLSDFDVHGHRHCNGPA